MSDPSDVIDLTPTSPQRGGSGALGVLWVFLRLGLTSFGGPVAHIGYFRHEFVARRRWLDDATFTDLVALCQFLPGPASSQVGFSVGWLRAGWLGGVAAWCGFTLPSVALLLAFAVLTPHWGGPLGRGVVHGLQLVAVAVVAQAVWDMARRLCPDTPRAAIALLAMGLLGVLLTPYAQLIVIVAGAVLGLWMCRSSGTAGAAALQTHRQAFHVPRSVGALALVLFVGLLLVLPAIAGAGEWPALQLFNAFYRSGALVFGGGHVVLPLLQQVSVASGWVGATDFLAGYGAAQAVPGPLFTFAAYLGWMAQPVGNHVLAATLATLGIFLPGLLLVLAALPFWHAMRAHPRMASALAGVNAAVVGLLASALYTPVWTSAVHAPLDFCIAATGFLLLVRWKLPPLAVVAFCAGAALAVALLGA